MIDLITITWKPEALITAWPDRVSIRDSYKFKRIKDMKRIIKDIRTKHSDCCIHQRSMFSLINEWWVSICYFILSCCYLRF